MGATCQEGAHRLKSFVGVHYTGCSIWIWDILKSYCGFVFGVTIFFPIIFMVEKCVDFDIWTVIKKDSKGPSYDLAHFSNFAFAENFKNEYNNGGNL